MLDFLGEKALINDRFKSITIDYKEGIIHYGIDEIILGYFTNYKELKQVQNSAIKVLRVVDQVLETDFVSRKVEEIRARKVKA